jgi:hypothetical protein
LIHPSAVTFSKTSPRPFKSEQVTAEKGESKANDQKKEARQHKTGMQKQINIG